MNKKRVLFMVNGLYGGGAENIFQTIINHLDRQKYAVTVYSLHEEDIDTDIYRNLEGVKHLFKKPSKHFIRNYGVLLHNKIKFMVYQMCAPELFYKLFVGGKYDVEVAFLEGYATRIIAGSGNKHSRKIAWVHTDLVHNRWTKIAYHSNLEEAKAYGTYDRIVCVSEDVRQKFQEKTGIRHHTSVQQNPVNELLITEKSQKQIQEHYREQVLRLISIGRLEPEKGYDRLVSALGRLKEGYAAFECWIIGSGSQYEELQRYLEEHELEEHVKLLGYQKNPYPYLAAADLFLCPSRAEGLSTVVTEAVILGKPVITTDCAGMGEIFGRYPCGIICENSEDGLYSALQSFMSHQKELLADYAEGVKQRGAELCLKERMHEIEELLDE